MPKLDHSPAYPAPRFTIRRLEWMAPTAWPWCVQDDTRPNYVGRFKSHRAAIGYIDGVLRGEARREKKEKASLSFKGPSIRELVIERLRRKELTRG